MGNVLFSCDGMVTPVQVDVEVMGWKKKCIWYVRGFEGIHLITAIERERRNMTFF